MPSAGTSLSPSHLTNLPSWCLDLVVTPREAGAAEGVSGLVIIGNVMPKEPSATENEAGHEVMVGVVHMVG